MDINELKEYLDFKAEQYENPIFLESDPLKLVHQFSKKEDCEIVGFLVATIAWGNRKSIITNGEKLIQLLDYQPHLEYPHDIHVRHPSLNSRFSPPH
jgi:hypothetical protein